MKILITGCNGQLGNELCRIISTGHSEIGAIDAVYHDAEVTAVDVDTLDITDTAGVKTFVCKLSPDIIINCAAMTNVDGCESNLEAAMKVNAVGVRNLAAAAETVGAKFVQISTDYVFNGQGSSPFVEWDVRDPQSIYGKSKMLGEDYAMSFCSRTFIIRTAWLYGYVGKNFVRTIRRIARSNDSIKVVSDQKGNPTSANDLAHHILKLILTEEYGIFHCTCEGECSWYDFASEIVRLSGINCTVIPCTTEEYGSPTKRPAYSSLENLMLKCTVGNEMRSWHDALAEYIKNVED